MEGRPLEDAELIRRSRGGDTSAYGELVKRYQQIALQTAYVVAGSEGEAEDATQEAFVKAYYSLERFQEARPFRPWLLRIVSNEALNRRKASRRRVALSIRSAAQDSGDAAPSPEAAALGKSRRQRLLAAVNELSEKDRLLIAYRYFLDLTEAETAGALRIPRGTAKSRMSRALKRLRAKLAEDPEFSDLAVGEPQ